MFAFRSPARALVAGLRHQDHVYSATKNHVVSTTKKSMKCITNWIPLRILVRSTTSKAPLPFFIWSLCRHTASPPITSETHTGGVQ